MFKKGYFISLVFAVFYLSLQAKEAKLIAGPVIGHTTATSSKIWLLVKNTSSIQLILTDESGTRLKVNLSTDKIRPHKNLYPVNFEFLDLEPMTQYRLTVELDGSLSEKTVNFRTVSNKAIQDFSFFVGSCALTYPNWIKWMVPGIKDRIFTNMLQKQADFMLWLGDSHYYRKKDRLSAEGMYHRHIKQRKVKRLNEFLSSGIPQYAIWDDHDYGPNNSDAHFELKDSSLAIFNQFWNNPYFGKEDVKGNFSHFSRHDVDFFLCDNRYYRNLKKSDGTLTQLGEGQLKWLFDQLKKSTATFKFVVMGSEVINEQNPHECYANYAEEQQELYSFIKDKNITGVVFLTGDMHYTQLLRKDSIAHYPLYDFTCSPLTSIVYKTATKNNRLNVGNSHILEHNFGRISITGERGNRKCHFEVFNKQADQIWKYSIEESELR